LCLLRAAWVREERATWLALGLGIVCWWPANMTYHLWIARRTPIPFPSISDAFWLASYPAFYVGIVLAARRHVASRHIGLWLDGVLGGLALAALTSAVVLQVALKGLGGPPATVATLLAYPLADIFLLLAAGVLVAGHFEPLNLLAIALASATILVAMLRTTLTVREVRALAESRRLAETDDLTGLGNRRHFFRRLDERLGEAVRGQTSVTLLLIDLDRFKELNDTLGHHVGDRLLREIGRRLRIALQPIETVARLGRDKFAL